MLNKQAIGCIALAGWLLALLSACGGGAGPVSFSQPPPASGITFSGTVSSGSQPITGSSVSVWTANPTPGAPATRLATATTGSNGQYSLNLPVVPANGQLIYLLAAGGDAGNGNNAAIGLMTVAGNFCAPGSNCGFSNPVVLNEFTTVASVYSLAAFVQITGGNVNVSGGSPGLRNAALTFASLVDASSGTESFQNAGACGGSGEPDNCSALRKLNTLGNVLAACVDSNGAGSVAGANLFQQTSASAGTLSAVFNLATQAAVRNDGAGMFSLAGAASVYAPSLASAPGDWTLAVSYGGGGLYQPAGIAIDAAGHVWVADYQQPAGAVSEFAPDGTPLSGTSGYSGGGLMGSFGIALDAQGNAWVANWNGGNGTSVTELAADGTPLSGSNGFTGGGLLGPIAVAIAPTGTLWAADSGNSAISQLNAAGQASGPFTGGGLGYPIALAVDTGGDVWVANQGS
ncbi:MAG: hypothetical protein KGK44_11825, partial [Gammaproteobacteria bacterium]|nr:hypothetical protein [Gammaproteobacteria bacterium]